MYLKRLELHGFKTFAPRTVLDFESGMTAVVGPNGSGKSNLADAVRWALGEQNLRNVRCRHADDLIFAGTTGRGPRSGARPPMNMAEVMMTFDNSAGWLPVEFHEVRIGRRLYRGGDAEYVLNGARVRLRDITDLLARASISAGGHLVIGQGLIDTVLNLRPEERRSLIETLAGLRFYYSRRDDAETKLRAAEANLRNVDAMIAEAAPHLAALQAQAAAYAQYHEVERELRQLLILHYAHAHAQARERRDRLDGELVAAQATLTAAADAVRTAEGELAGVRERQRQRAGEASARRGELRAAHDARETAERDLAVSRARREAAASRLEDLRGGLPALESRRAEAAKELARADEAARAIESERAALHEARGAVDRAVEAATAEVAQAERALRTLAERRRELERHEAAAAAELAAIEREEAAARDEQQRLSMDQQATAKGLHGAEAALAAARTAADAAAARLEELRAAESKARLLAAEASERARLAAAERRSAARCAEELQARAAGLRAWLEAMGGGTSGGPTVAAALTAAPEVEQALAAALGPILAAQPAASDLSASDAAHLLSMGVRGVFTSGRAALDATAQRALEDTLAAHGVARDAIAGWGDALARIDAPATTADALRAALSVVLVLRDLAAAWQAHALLARMEQPAARLVILATLDGAALAPSGLLHRPAGDGAAALARARELRAVEAEADGAAEALRRAEAAANAADEQQRQRAAASEAALRALRAAEHERNARRNEVTAAERAVAQARRERDWAAERAAIARGAAPRPARRWRNWRATSNRPRHGTRRRAGRCSRPRRAEPNTARRWRSPLNAPPTPRADAAPPTRR